MATWGRAQSSPASRRSFSSRSSSLIRGNLLCCRLPPELCRGVRPAVAGSDSKTTVIPNTSSRFRRSAASRCKSSAATSAEGFVRDARTDNSNLFTRK